MSDTISRFYQGYIAASGTTMFTVPTGQQYTVRNIVLSNNSKTGGSGASLYINSKADNSYAIIPSGSMINPAAIIQTTDFYAFATGDSLIAVLASGSTNSITASVHGITTL